MLKLTCLKVKITSWQTLFWKCNTLNRISTNVNKYGQNTHKCCIAYSKHGLFLIHFGFSLTSTRLLCCAPKPCHPGWIELLVIFPRMQIKTVFYFLAATDFAKPDTFVVSSCVWVTSAFASPVYVLIWARVHSPSLAGEWAHANTNKLWVIPCQCQWRCGFVDL